MICACLFPINRIPTLFGPLSANLAAAGNVSGGLSAAASASASAAAAAAASANAALSAALSANALANLTAAANFALAMKATFHINLLDPLKLIEAAIADLVNSLNTNGFPSAVASLPTPALPKLLDLAGVADGVLSANLAAAAGLMANANAGAQLAAALNANATLSGALSGSLAGSANLGLMLAAQAAAKAAFGVNLAASGAMSKLGPMLDTLGSNIDSSPMQSLSGIMPAAALAKALKMLDALAAIKKAFGADLLKPGAGKDLNKALGKSLADSLGKSADRSKSLGKSLSQSKGKDLSESKSKQYDEAASQMLDEGWDDVSKKVPSVPKVPNLLAMLMNALLSYLGLDIIQNQACGKKCLFALPGLFAPMGCLCPKVEPEITKPSLSLSGGATPSFSASGSGSATASGSATPPTPPTITGSATGSAGGTTGAGGSSGAGSGGSGSAGGQTSSQGPK